MSKMSVEIRQKISQSKLAEKKPMWRGDNIGLAVLFMSGFAHVYQRLINVKCALKFALTLMTWLTSPAFIQGTFKIGVISVVIAI